MLYHGLGAAKTQKTHDSRERNTRTQGSFRRERTEGAATASAASFSLPCRPSLSCPLLQPARVAHDATDWIITLHDAVSYLCCLLFIRIVFRRLRRECYIMHVASLLADRMHRIPARGPARPAQGSAPPGLGRIREPPWRLTTIRLRASDQRASRRVVRPARRRDSSAHVRKKVGPRGDPTRCLEGSRLRSRMNLHEACDIGKCLCS